MNGYASRLCREFIAGKPHCLFLTKALRFSHIDDPGSRSSPRKNLNRFQWFGRGEAQVDTVNVTAGEVLWTFLEWEAYDENRTPASTSQGKPCLFSLTGYNRLLGPEDHGRQQCWSFAGA